MTNKTNNEIYELLGEVKSDQKYVLKKMDEIVASQKEHTIEDNRRFATWEKKLSTVNRYYSAVGGISGFIGGIAGFCIDHFLMR